jgi:ATP adenylyltransferase
MVDCILCSELEDHEGRAPWNAPLIETENFVVIPSLGALVEGWLLIVPKRHHISYGALPVALRAEADALEVQTRELLESQYKKPVVTFEHGPSAAKHGTGCGVDHAHLHLVPIECDLFATVVSFVPPTVQWMASDWSERENAYRSGLDYLYLKPSGSGGLIAVADDFGSQVFRKAISFHLGVEGEYSWRDYPRIETVTQTIEALIGAHAQLGRGVVYAA